MKKRSSVLIAAAVAMSLTVQSPHVSHAADDITGHYFETSLRELVEQDIMGGYDDGTFRPNNEVTRAEFTAFLVRALDLPGTGEPADFSDVQEGKWYTMPVEIASGYGIIGGYPDGTFKPNNNISRQEMAVMIKRALDHKGVSAQQDPLNFADNQDIHPMYHGAIQELLYLNVFSGKAKGDSVYFAPLDNTTRGETAAIITRMLDIIDNPKEVIEYTNYPVDFNQFVDVQAALTPKLDGAGRYIASRGLVEYYVNPSNFKEGTPQYLQFLVLSQSADLDAEEVNQKVLQGKGVLEGEGQAFIEAGETYDVNEVYLIAHALHETGEGKSPLAQGIEVGLNKDGKPEMVTEDNKEDLKNIKTVYNVYGTGAIDENAVKYGSERAYKEGWFTVADAIIGGTKYVGEKYIHAGQNTLYKMKWDINWAQDQGNAEYPHQYATHVRWAELQTKRMQKIYDSLDSYTLKYDVPVYAGQPGPTTLPTGAEQYYVDTERAGETGEVTVAIGLNLREGPHTSFNPPIRNLPDGTEFRIIGENGGWYKVVVDDKFGWIAAHNPNDPKEAYVQLDSDENTNIASTNVQEATAEEVEETTE